MEKSLGLKSYSVIPGQPQCLYHSDQSSLYIILGREVGATLYEVLKSLNVKLTNSSKSEIPKDEWVSFASLPSKNSGILFLEGQGKGRKELRHQQGHDLAANLKSY